MNTLRIGMVGYDFMGKAHSHAFRDVTLFFDVPLRPQLVAICGRNEERVRAAAERYGFAGYETSWETLVARDDVDLVAICSPGDTHYPIALAAAAHGKHVLCEKPLANSLAQAREMYRAVEQAGVKHMVSWNLRRTPAIAHMRDLVRRGEIGDLYHFRARWASDWSLSPDYPLVWRMQAEHGGTGALGDLGSHLVDLSRYILDRELEQVIGMGDTFVRERPLLAAADRRGPVTVDDATVFMGRFVGGGLASFEVTRMAAGRRDEFSVEVNGSRGSLVFERTRPNELRFYSAADPEEVQGFRTIHTTGAAFPYAGAWWPRGLGIDYGESFVNQAYDLLVALARDEMPRPNFADGMQNQAVLDAVERSVASRQWIDVSAFAQRPD